MTVDAIASCESRVDALQPLFGLWRVYEEVIFELRTLSGHPVECFLWQLACKIYLSKAWGNIYIAKKNLKTGMALW